METGGTPRHAPLFTLRLTALRIHLQNLDIRARSIHLKSDPPHAGTEQLVSAKLFFVKIFDLCILNIILISCNSYTSKRNKRYGNVWSNYRVLSTL